MSDVTELLTLAKTLTDNIVNSSYAALKKLELSKDDQDTVLMTALCGAYAYMITAIGTPVELALEQLFYNIDTMHQRIDALEENDKEPQ